MELLAGAFEDPFRGEPYEVFEEVQEKVGTVNDHATAIATLKEWYERAKDEQAREELAKLIAEEEEQLDAKHQAFLRWWTPDRTANLKQRFASVLQTPVPSAPKSTRLAV